MLCFSMSEMNGQHRGCNIYTKVSSPLGYEGSQVNKHVSKQTKKQMNK